MTLEVPGLPEPSVKMSTPRDRATITALGKRAEQVGERDERECDADPPTLRQPELWHRQRPQRVADSDKVGWDGVGER